MKLHYKGTYDLNPDSLPHGEHPPGAVPFKEAEDSKALAKVAGIAGLVLLIIFSVLLYLRCGNSCFRFRQRSVAPCAGGGVSARTSARYLF
jgi:hypothetical protein